MGRWQAAALRLIGIGWYIAACILLGTLGGRWVGLQLDGSSEGLFTILGLFLGLTMAFIGVYRMLKPLLLDEKDDRSND